VTATCICITRELLRPSVCRCFTGASLTTAVPRACVAAAPVPQGAAVLWATGERACRCVRRAAHVGVSGRTARRITVQRCRVIDAPRDAAMARCCVRCAATQGGRGAVAARRGADTGASS
jgi:hypothetical protein